MNELLSFVTTHSETIIWWIETIGTLLGFFYMYLEYKAKPALWPIGIIWSLCYLTIFLAQGFYAWSATWAYYLFANIYGMATWKRKAAETGDYLITRMKRSWRVPVILACIILTLPLIFFVKRYNPYVSASFDIGSCLVLFSEAVSTSLGIVGMYLLAKKVAEQWIIWIVVNGLYLVASLYVGNWQLAIFYMIYTPFSVMGWVRWKRESKEK